MIIAPLKTFLIDLKLNNPSDAGTYYVRAVVKNAVTGATLLTQNLTDNGSKYFSYPWVTPADSSGTGLQITIAKTVYDDSGYTTESVAYGTTVDTYIVRDLAGIRSTFGGSGSSSVSIDYEKIRKMIAESIASIDFPEVKESKPYDDAEMMQSMDDMHEKMMGMMAEMPKTASNESITKLAGELIDVKNQIKSRLKEIENNESVRSSYLLDCVERIEGLVGTMATMDVMEEKTSAMSESLSSVRDELTKKIEEVGSRPVNVKLPPLQYAAQESEGKREKIEAPKSSEVESPHQMTVQKLLRGY